MKCGKSISRRNVTLFVETWECDWWKLYNTDGSVKEPLRESFPFKRPFRQDQLMDKIKSGALFGYVQCDIKVPEHLRMKNCHFPANFQKYKCISTRHWSNNTGVCREEIVNVPTRANANIMFWPDQWHHNYSLSTSHLKLGLVCTKNYRFVEYTPVKCFNNFVQSAVNARCQRDENPNTNAVAESMKLLANSSYGYQIRDGSRHSMTKYTNDKKTHAAINNKVFRRLGYINDQLYEVELAKSEIEHNGPIIVGFFILQYAMLRISELYYNFFSKFCDIDKYVEIWIDTNSLYLSLAEKQLYGCIRSENRQKRDLLRKKDCYDSFTANACSYFFLRTCCPKHRKRDKKDWIVQGKLSMQWHVVFV